VSGRVWSSLFGGLAVLLSAVTPPPAVGQSLSFYGRENIQLVEVRYAPVLTPETGGNYELVFGFLTSADQLDTPGQSRVFNGVALGGGGFNWTDAEIDGHERNAAAGYITLMYRGYWFAEFRSDSRVYLNWTAGLARGAFWGDPVGEIDAVASAMNLYCGGLGAGVSFQLKEKYYLELGLTAEARGVALDEEFLGYFPVMVTVGVSKNIGGLKHDRLPEL